MRGMFRTIGRHGQTILVAAITAAVVAGGPAVAHVTSNLSHLWGAPNHIKAKVKSYGDTRWVRRTAAGAGPVAYAHVNSDGTLDAANSKNVTATSLYTILGNYYCIDLAVPYKTITVTPEGIDSYIAVPSRGDPFTSCGGTGDVTVQTFDDAGSGTAVSFNIVFN